MTRLIILTPSPDEPRFAMILDRWVGRLRPPLEAVGFVVEARPWTDVGDLSGVGAITPLLAWSYHRNPVGWASLLDQLDREGVRVANPTDLLRWNTRKTYLAELEAAGAPIIPTLFADAVTPAILAEAHARFGPEIIVKPQVSGGSHATVRHTDGAPLADGPDGPAMLQPFLPAITGEGEISLLYFGGAFSHAVAKIAAADDFRVQFQHGGRYQAITPPSEALEVGGAVLKAAGRNLAYARIDLLRGEDGVLRLMELECIEPDLYLDLAPDGGEAFAAAMARAIG